MGADPPTLEKSRRRPRRAGSAATTALMVEVTGIVEGQLNELDERRRARTPETQQTYQEDDCVSYRNKPLDAEGISRATWYRRHRETAETVRQAGEAGETETGETVRQTAETEAVETEADKTETAGETAPETSMQPSPDAPADRYNLLMAALEMHYHGHAPERRQQAVEDAQKYQAKWGENAQRASWTVAQEAELIWQLRGREVKQLTSAQAVVGNKVIYRAQLGD